MNNRLAGLNLLSSFKNTDWKIGQTDFYINSITSRVDTLPNHVFNKFYINNDPSRKISTVDFALLTYDMGISERNRLMELYGIESQTIDEIFKTADDISAFLDSLSEHPVDSDINTFHDAENNDKKTFKSAIDDEFDI